MTSFFSALEIFFVHGCYFPYLPYNSCIPLPPLSLLCTPHGSPSHCLCLSCGLVSGSVGVSVINYASAMLLISNQLENSYLCLTPRPLPHLSSLLLPPPQLKKEKRNTPRSKTVSKYQCSVLHYQLISVLMHGSTV